MVFESRICTTFSSVNVFPNELVQCILHESSQCLLFSIKTCVISVVTNFRKWLRHQEQPLMASCPTYSAAFLVVGISEAKPTMAHYKNCLPTNVSYHWPLYNSSSSVVQRKVDQIRMYVLLWLRIMPTIITFCFVVNVSRQINYYGINYAHRVRYMLERFKPINID